MEQLTVTKMESNFEAIREVDAITIDAKTLSSDFSLYQSSKFKNVRIYGTVIDPLFVAKDIEKALEIKNLHIRDLKTYVLGKHYVKVRINTDAGAREALALTEQGLYEAVYTSRSELARDFKDFIYVVLRRLRLEGSVSIDEAKEDHESYKEEYAEHIQNLKVKLEGHEKQLDELHELANYNKEHMDRNWDQMQYYRAQVLSLENELDARRDRTVELLEEKLDELLQECGNTVYVYTVRPPKIFREMFTEDQYSWEEDDVGEDDTTFFGLFDNEPMRGIQLGEVYLKKPNKASWLKGVLRKERCTAVPKQGDELGKRLPLAETMPNCFYGSFDFVRMYVRDMFLNVRGNPAEIPTDVDSDLDPLL